jgi:hypothetical protein
MTKEERVQRKDKTIIIRRNHAALRAAKVNVSINKAENDDAFNAKLLKCNSQASVIQLCIENNKAKAFIADLLVKQSLCKSEESAIARIQRHVRHDVNTRIVSRSLRINS